MQRMLVTLGLVLLVTGLAWPLLARLGLGHLPGDIRIERGDFRFYFPLGTSLLISLLLTVVFWLIRR